MPRARNIKPGIIQNDDLAALDNLARIAFPYMWMLADFNGNIEYKPAKLKVQVLPYDNVDIEFILTELERGGFIQKYHENGSRYLHICNFEKHQNPHKNEILRGTNIPTPEDVQARNPDQEKGEEKHKVIHEPEQVKKETEQVQHENGSRRADSGFLIPDSGYRIPEDNTPPKSPKGDSIDYSSWPELPDDQILKDWLKARKKAKAVHSQTAINAIGKELHRALAMGYTVNQCGEEAATRGWRGFKAEWMQNAQNKSINGTGQPGNYDGQGWGDGFDPTS